MAAIPGMYGKLYYCVAGIGGTPTWVELKNVKDVTTTLQKAEADVTTRANKGWRATIGTLKEGSIEFEMIWDTDDTGFVAVRKAWFEDKLIGIAAMTGDIKTNGSEGLWADCSVIDFTRGEPLEEAMTVSVTLKPTYSENAPRYVVVGETPPNP